MTHPTEAEALPPKPWLIQLEIASDFEPEDGDAFDAVVDALNFAEIPAKVQMARRGCFARASEPMAAISAEHLSVSTMQHLEADGDGFEGLVFYPNEYGAFLVVNHFAHPKSEAWPSSWPPDLVALMDLARADGLQWLKLDAHAPRIEGVPLYPREDARETPDGRESGALPRSRP